MMHIQKLREEKLLREFQITFPKETVSHQIDEKLDEIALKATIPGFRVGKVPASLVKQRYGASVEKEVCEALVEQGVKDLLAQENLSPVFAPNCAVKSTENGLDFTVSFEVMPLIGDIDFSAISLTQYNVEVEFEKIQAELEKIARVHKLKKGVDREAREGDVVKVLMEGKVDGKSVVERDTYEIDLGSENLLSEFKKNMVGVKKGDQLQLVVNYPENSSSESLAGKKVDYDVDVEEICEATPHEIGDELAQKEGFENFDELERGVKKDLKKYLDDMSHDIFRAALLDDLDQRVSCDVPEQLVVTELKSIIGDLHREGRSGDEALWEKEHRPLAERRVKLGLLFAEVAKKNQIEVSNQEIHDVIRVMADYLPGKERELISLLKKNRDYFAMIHGPLLERKIIDFLEKSVTLMPQNVSRQEIEKIWDEVMKDEEGHVHDEHCNHPH